MKFQVLVWFLILLIKANAVNRCHYLYEEKVVESLLETIKKIIEELEVAKASSFALVFDDLSQGIERVLEEFSYILDLFDLVDEKDVDLTTKDAKKFEDLNVKYSESLKDLQAWNEVNEKNRRKRQINQPVVLTNALNNLSTINSNTLAMLQMQAYPNLNFCPSIDNYVVYPGVAYLPSCDGNRPARIYGITSRSPCANQEMMGVNASYYCFHPALRWVFTSMANAFIIHGALTVTKDSGDKFLIARFNFTKNGQTYQQIGYYFIYDFSIEFWDGTQSIRSTNYPNNFDILTCRVNQNPLPVTKIPCRWSQTNIIDANGNYLKTACIVPLAHTQSQATYYCRSIGWELYNIESEDERGKLSDFAFSVQPGTYNIQGRKGIDGSLYCGSTGGSCFLQPPAAGQWPDGSCMAFSFDGYQNHYAVRSDCDNNKFYSICQ